MAIGKRYNLVEHGERVAHTTIGLPRDELQGLGFGFDALLTGDVGQLVGNVLNGDALEVVGLTTAQDGGQDFLLLGRTHHENRVVRRLFQRLQKGVECGRREHVNLIDDEDLVTTRLRRYLHLVNQFADIIDRVVRRRIQLIDVVGTLFVERAAALALVAGLALGREVLAVDGLGKDTRAGRLTHAARTAEEIGMGQLPAHDSVFQRLHEALLSHDGLEVLRTVFSGTYDVVRHNLLRVLTSAAKIVFFFQLAKLRPVNFFHFYGRCPFRAA